MDKNKQILTDEFNNEFNRLKEVFIGSGSEAKFNASAETLALISRYLGYNTRSFDFYPITTVLGEYAKIIEGGKPEFIELQKTREGVLPTHYISFILLASWQQSVSYQNTATQ